MAEDRGAPKEGESIMTDITLAEYWPDFLELCELKCLARVTVRDYQKQWRLRIEPRFGGSTFRELRFGEIQRWILGMSRSCAKHTVATMRVMINSAIDDGHADVNPFDGRKVRYPPNRVRPRPLWGAAEVEEAMRRLRTSRIEPLFLLLVGGGLRVEEALAVRWRNVEPTGTGVVRVRISAAWTEADGEKPTKNEFSTRLMPIAPPFSTLLEGHRGNPRDKLWTGYGRDASRYWSVLFDSCMPLHGLPKVHLCNLRAVHETLMQEAGVLDTLNARMHGRTNVITGYRHYLRPDAAMDAAAVECGKRFMHFDSSEHVL